MYGELDLVRQESIKSEHPLIDRIETLEKKGENDERYERVMKRAVGPKSEFISYLKTNNFDEAIHDHKVLIKQILENPFQYYCSFRERLTLHGQDANFPEFEGVISYLVKKIFQTEEIINFYDDIKFTVIVDQLINKLISINIKDRYNYPYRSTISLIESLLEILDFYYRNTWVYDVTLPVNETIGPYYHIFRYRSYMTTFMELDYGIPNNIIFPTFYNLGATDLIKIRCVPILFLGISKQPVYVDQYLNTPLDFMAHDIQHSKRQIQETLRYYDLYVKHSSYYSRRTLFDIVSELDFYEYMSKFTKDVILPMIIPNIGDTERVLAEKNISKIIIFEVVHEKAWPITRKSLCRNILLRYDEFPVENLKVDDGEIKVFHYLFSDPSTLGNVICKLRFGFYDKASNVNDKIVNKYYRTSKNIAMVAENIIKILFPRIKISFDYFLALSLDRRATQEFKDVVEINIPDDTDSLMYSCSYPDDFSDELANMILIQDFIPHVDDISKDNQLHKLDEVPGLFHFDFLN